MESDFNSALDATFKNVKILKETERLLLVKLEKQTVNEILSNEDCIELLRESSDTSEEIAAHLRKV